MPRTDRIATLDPPAREHAFPSWPSLRDLEKQPPDTNAERRARLRFLALRIMRRLADHGAAVPQHSLLRQIEAVETSLKRLPANDIGRIRLSRFLRVARERSPRSLVTAALDLGEAVEAAGQMHSAAECYRSALDLLESHGITDGRERAVGLLTRITRSNGGRPR